MSSTETRRALFEGLVCPACVRPLDLWDQDRVSPPRLSCARCGRRWPICQRTPVFASTWSEAIPPGPAALLHDPDVEAWPDLQRSLERADPRLFAHVFASAQGAPPALPPFLAGARAAVLGCGWGRVASQLAEVCKEVYASDDSHVRARFANVRAYAEGRGNLLAATAGLDSLPFPAGVFHLVVVEERAVAAILRDRRYLLARLGRARALLAPDGVLAVCRQKQAGMAARWAARRLEAVLAQAGFAPAALPPPSARPEPRTWAVAARSRHAVSGHAASLAPLLAGL